MACERMIWQKTVPEKITTVVIGPNQERNLVGVRAAISWGGVLRDETKMAARETQPLVTALQAFCLYQKVLKTVSAQLVICLLTVQDSLIQV